LRCKKLTVITEAGREVGFGHLTRTIAIASRFKLFNYDINFIINGDKSIDNLLIHYKFELLNWLEKDLSFKLKNSDLILLDSMLISNKQIKEIEKIDIPLIYIDDEKQRDVLEKGFIIDWTILREENNSFSFKKDVIYLLGSKFTPLRKEFKNLQQNIIKPEIESVLVTFGGSDIRNITPKIVMFLSEYFPKIKKNIIIGGGFTNLRDIEQVSDKNTTLFKNINASAMLQLMQKSDLAIASGGQTLYELATVGLPSISILVVDNAYEDTIGWDKVGVIKYLSKWDDKELLSKLHQIMQKLQSKNFRLKMQENSQNFIAKDGAYYLVKTILERL